MAATAIAYSALFANSFIDFDDPVYITGNPHIREGLTVDTWAWAWTSLEAGNWHPLAWISHATDVDLFAMNPAGHHLSSLLVHILNSTLLYLLLTKISRDKGRCLVAATLFALHPLAVESVSWAAERKNVLCTLFFLLAIAAYGRYVCRPGVARYLLVAIAFALGLTAKPMVITLPFVLLLLDYWPLGRIEALSSPNPVLPVAQLGILKLIVEKVPLFVLSLASAIVTLIAQSSAGAVASVATIPLASRVADAIYAYFDYIFKAFWPAGLVPFYPQIPLNALQIVGALLFMAGMSTVAWFKRANWPYLLVGWLFYLGTLIPVIGLVQVGEQAMADRYTYIPMIGIFVAVVWLADDFAVARKLESTMRAVLPTVILAMLAVVTWRQVRLWHDDIKLWSYSLAMTEDNAVAEDNLGIALLKEGKTEEALPHFYHATRLNPSDPISAANVATDLLAHGRFQEAIDKYQAALTKAALVPMLLPNIHSNLGSAYLSLGNAKQAREHYQLALQLNPDDEVARSGLQKLSHGAAAPARQ